MKVHGADLVKPSDVEKALRMAMQRVEDWSSRQEEKLLTMWKAPPVENFGTQNVPRCSGHL